MALGQLFGGPDKVKRVGVSTKLDRSFSFRKRYLDTARPRLGHNSVRRDAAVILLCVYVVFLFLFFLVRFISLRMGVSTLSLHPCLCC